VKDLLRANKRLNSAYLFKESFGQLWSYEREGWARRFFEKSGVGKRKNHAAAGEPVKPIVNPQLQAQDK